MAADSNPTGSMGAMMFVEKATATSSPRFVVGLGSRLVTGYFMGPAAASVSIGRRGWSIIAIRATADLVLLMPTSRSLIGDGPVVVASNTCSAVIGPRG